MGCTSLCYPQPPRKEECDCSGQPCPCSCNAGAGGFGGAGGGPGGSPGGPGGHGKGPGNGPAGFRAKGESGISSNPIHYGFGEVRLHVVDLMASGFDGPWGHTRTYSNRLSVDAEMGNGYNWLIAQWPKLAHPDNNTYVLVFNANDSVTFIWNVALSVWVVQDGARYALKVETGIIAVVGPQGQTWRFTDFSNMNSNLWGQFSSFTSPGGKTITATPWNPTGLQDRDRIGKVERSYGTTTERLLYGYETGGRITSVKLQRQVSGVGTTDIRQVLFTYYGTGDSNGSEWDLKFAKEQVWTGASWADLGTRYYRYYTSADQPNGDGGPYDLKMAFSPEAYARLAAAYPSDGSGASDANAAAYADHYFKYHNAASDSSHVGFVRSEAVRGGEGTYSYAYEDSGLSDGYNNWKVRTDETQPDGTHNIVFTNYIGQVILKEVKNGSNSWVTYQSYDLNNSRLTQIAYPSAIASYSYTSTSLSITYVTSLASNTRLFRVFSYATSTTATDNADGDVAGLLKSESVKNGSSGTPVKLVEYQYRRRTVGAVPVDFLAKKTVYRNTDGSGAIVTAYDYGSSSNWYSGTYQPMQVTTTLPAVPTSQNGENVAHTRKEYYDDYGNQTWEQGPKGYIRKLTYDIVTGGVTQRIEDVDTTGGILPGWTMPAGGGLNVVTDYEVESLGRTTQSLGPAHDINGTSVRRATWTVYDDAGYQIRSASGYQAGGVFTLINPVSITVFDKNGRVTEQRRATRASTSGKLLASDTFAQSTWVRWSKQSFNNKFQREWTRVYSSVPTSGDGSSGTNYDQSDFGCDSMGRLNKVRQPGGTITRTLFEDRGLPKAIYVGTNDTGATDTDADGTGAPNNMLVVAEFQYDANGNRTEVKQWVNSSSSRITTFTYDFRDRLVTENGEVDLFRKSYYDNLDQVIKVERYNTSEAAANLLEQTGISFDERGRPYQTIRYEINSSGTATGNKLTDNVWYDAAGNVIKEQPAGSKLFTKYVFDGLARLTRSYVGYDAAETGGSYTGVDTVSGDTLFEQTENSYDAASNLTLATSYSRKHTGSVTDALTTSTARRAYVASWYDALGRRTAQADYGTNGGSALTRPSSAPSRSDTVLVTSWEFNSEGEGFKVIDPMARETRSEFDAKDRRTKVTENYVDGTQSSVPDEDKITLFEYNGDDQLTKLTAKNPDTGDQITEYLYGTTAGVLMDLSTGHFLREINYPDKDPLLASDRVLFYRNRQGEVNRRLDQHDSAGTDVGAHDYSYDGLGRVLHDGVSYLDAAKDGTVRRLTYAYTPKGQLSSVQSWSLQTPGSGTQINEVLYNYTDFGLLDKEYQEHEGAKQANSLYCQYSYDTTVASGEYTKGLRLTKVRYPNARLVHHTFNGGQEDNTSTPSQRVYMADQINRLNAIQADSSGFPGTTMASYKYLGLSNIVEEFLEEAKLKMLLDYNNDLGYAGLDSFGRLIELRWQNTTLSSLVDRYAYGYNRNGNRTFRDNLTSANKDEVYTYDGLNQLKNMDRGNMVFPYTNPPTIQEATPLAERDFTFDATGNWKGYVEKTSGTTGLNQSRTHNTANEIGTIGASTGTNWADPTYDRVGNMVTGPKPTSLGNSYTFKYDAWNRLVEVKDGATLIGRYEYDGLHRRTKSHIDSQAPSSPNGVDKYRHFFYNSAWQILETRVSNSENTAPETLSVEYQWVWSARYIDSPVMREQISNSQRLYYATDGNANVTGLFNTSTLAVERYTYDLYGQVNYYDGNWTASSSSYDNSILFGGYYQDKESLLYLARHRHLHSWLGRWLQRDPVGYGGGNVNLYGYCGAGVATCADPYGMMGERGWPKTCSDVNDNGKGINYAQDLTRRLKNKINAYRGAGNKQDIGHYQFIRNECDQLAKMLKLIAECCGPRTPEAQAAIDATSVLFEQVQRQCEDRGLKVPSHYTQPGYDPDTLDDLLFETIFGPELLYPNNPPALTPNIRPIWENPPLRFPDTLPPIVENVPIINIDLDVGFRPEDPGFKIVVSIGLGLMFGAGAIGGAGAGAAGAGGLPTIGRCGCALKGL